MRQNLVIGVDVGGTYIRIGMVDEKGTVYEPQILDAGASGQNSTVEYLLNIIQEYIAPRHNDAAAVAIGFPATLNKERTALINTPNLSGLDGIEIKTYFERALALPVFIDKDAAMLLQYDMYSLGICNKGTVVGIYFGTGIGNSIVIDGKFLTGRDGVACELGHVPVPGRQDPCGCGLKGCLELYAGGKGLERINKEHFKDGYIGEVFVSYAESCYIKEFVRFMADAVILEVNILNPDAVIIGGGVTAMPGFPKDRLREAIIAGTRKPVPGDSLRLFISSGGDRFNGVAGAGLSGFRHIREL